MANNKEWEKEMMKWRKIDIINFLEAIIEGKENAKKPEKSLDTGRTERH